MYTKCNLSNAMKNLYMKLICNKTCVLFKWDVHCVFVSYISEAVNQEEHQMFPSKWIMHYLGPASAETLSQ